MQPLLILAAASTPDPHAGDWQVVREVFRHDGPGEPFAAVRWIVLIASVTLIILAGRQLVRGAGVLRRRSAPLRFFHEFSSELGLGLSDQHLLVRIARHESLPTPLTLVLSAATLRHHAGRYAQTLPPRRRDKLAARVAALAATLFE